MGNIYIRTAKNEEEQHSVAKVSYGTVNKYLDAGQKLTVEHTRKKIIIKRLSSDVSVTITNKTTENWYAETSRPQRETLDDILKPDKFISIPPFGTVTLRR